MSPKIKVVGVTEDHLVPNERSACRPGILVVVVSHNRRTSVFAAASGNAADLAIANPIGFGGSQAGYYYNGRSLRELPKSSFTLRVNKDGGDNLMSGFVIEPRLSQSMFKRVGDFFRGLRNR